MDTANPDSNAEAPPMASPLAPALASPLAPPMAPTGAPPAQVIYLPSAPVKRTNRFFGSLIALIATWVYAGLMALVIVVLLVAITGQVKFTFVGSATFYIPVLFFAVAMLIVVVIANRAGWWSYMIGSAIVALVVYFGSAGMILLLNGVVLATPEQAALLFREVLANPITVSTAVVAREVAIWAGLIVSRRGKRVTAANLVARQTFDRDIADRERADRERAGRDRADRDRADREASATVVTI